MNFQVCLRIGKFGGAFLPHRLFNTSLKDIWIKAITPNRRNGLFTELRTPNETRIAVLRYGEDTSNPPPSGVKKMDRRQYVVEKWAKRTFTHFTVTPINRGENIHSIEVAVYTSSSGRLWTVYWFIDMKSMRKNTRLNSERLYRECYRIFQQWNIAWEVLTPSALQHIIDGQVRNDKK